MNEKRCRFERGAPALLFAFLATLAVERDACAADAPACKEEMPTLIRALDDWSRHFRANEDRARAAHRCSDPGVVCLDRFGKSARGAIPARVLAGQTLAVSVIFPAIDSATLTLTAAARASTALSTGTQADAESRETLAVPEARCAPSPDEVKALQSAAAPIAKLAAEPGLEELATPRDAKGASNGAAILAAWAAWAATHHEESADFASLDAKLDVHYGDDVETIDFTRTERGARTPSSTVHHDIVVDNGRYHLELSVLVPVVYHGERRATLSPAANASELRVGIEDDWHVTGALMLDLFPFGRQKGQLTSFRECRSRSCFENWLGLQFGTGFDHPARDWYAGIAIEPVSGLALGIGVAFVKGDFLGAGLAEGMLLPSATTLSVDSHYMARPYLGLAVTTDIVHAIDRGSISTHALR